MNERAREKAGKRIGQRLSAQEYQGLTRPEKDDLRELLVESGRDPDDWERDMKKLWPKKFTPKELTWRKSTI